MHKNYDKFQNLFTPLLLKPNLTVPSRIYFAPIGIDRANSNGGFSNELLGFYKDIMDGGCNFIFLANASVSKDSRLNEGGMCLYDKEHSESLIPLLNLANQKKSIIGIQLQHYGGQGITTLTNSPVLTPSGVLCKIASKRDKNYRTKIMDEDDIKQVIQQFAYSAKLAKLAGAKLIQLQASNGYLLNSFLSPYTNLRQDEYGGNEEKRAKLLLDIIKAIKENTNNEIAITVRLGIDDCVGESGIQPEKIINTVKELERNGVAAITCSMCIAETFYKFLNYSKEMEDHLHKSVKFIKSNAKIPIGFEGFIGSLQKSEALISEGVADFVGMARALFADNELINKTLAENEKSINYCLWDGNCFKDKSNPKFDKVYCCVNPKYLRPSI